MSRVLSSMESWKKEVYVEQPPGFVDPRYPDYGLQTGQSTLWLEAST